LGVGRGRPPYPVVVAAAAGIVVVEGVVEGVVVVVVVTPWSRVLLEKLTVCPLVKEFPAFYGARRFVNAVTSARHLSVS
jgi:hypothetical protein